MFFSSYKDIIFVLRNGLKFYSRKNFESRVLEFPPNLVSDQEVIDQVKLEEYLVEFLAGLGIKKIEALIVLSGEVLFQKSAPKTDKIVESVKAFIEQIPFDPKQISWVEIERKETVEVIATSSAIYRQVKGCVEKVGGEVLGVVPIVLFGEVSGANDLGAGEIKYIFNNSKHFKQADFLTVSKALEPTKITGAKSSPEQTEEEENEAKPFLKYAAWAVMVLIFSGGIFAGLIYFDVYKNPFAATKQKESLKKEATGSAKAIEPPKALEIIASESAKVKEASRSASIEILNGTGIAGQAVRVKEILERLGYFRFEVGNADSSNNIETMVFYKTSVSENFIKEIFDALSENYQRIASKSAQNSQEVDIRIITGRIKQAN